MGHKRRDTSTLITGFHEEVAVDRFVMAEIRYFKSMEMQVYRCEGNALRFDFQDLPPVVSIFQDLSRRYPDLSCLGDVGAAGVRLHAGEDRAAEAGADVGDYRPTEEIYTTF